MWQIEYLLGTQHSNHASHWIYFVLHKVFPIWKFSDFVGDSHKVVKEKTSLKNTTSQVKWLKKQLHIKGACCLIIYDH